MKRSSSLTLAVLLTAVLVCGSAEGAAQKPDSAAADTSGLVPYELQGITVTVTRARQQINRLPYAASVLGLGQIRGFERTVSLDESLLEVPGVFVYNRYNSALGNRISIRGFGSRAQFGVRGIRVIQDGIPLTLPDGQTQLTNLDLGAAARIEVIRGPAASLYGNAAGGVISIQSGEPPFVPIQGRVRLLGGSFGNDRFYQKYDVEAAGRAGGAGRIDYMGHLSYFETDGYRLHSAARSTLFNTRVRYRPDSRSELTAVINYANTPRAENPSSLADSIARVKPDTARDLALSLDECPADPGFGGCQDLGEESEQGQAGLSYRRRFSSRHELVLSGYGQFRKLSNPIPFTLIDLDRWAGGVHVEHHYTPGGRVLAALTFGFDLDHQNDDRQEFARDEVGLGDIALDQVERVSGLGLFANAGFPITNDLRLAVSARYDLVRFKVEDRLVTSENPDDSGSQTFDQLSPMVGLTYWHAPWLNLYLNVGRSFQTPTTTELTNIAGGLNEDLQPERATNYEVGAKGSTGGRLSYSLAVFTTNFEDLLIGFEPPGLDRTVFSNAGSSTYNGIEAALSALVVSDLIATFAYTYSDFTFDDFQTSAGDFSGNDVPGIPPHQFHGKLNYIHVSGLSGLVRLTVVDAYHVDNANENKNDAFALLDLRLGYDGGIRWRFTPFLGIDNILDERYNSSVVVNAFGGRFFEPAPGRNVYVGLQVQFQ